MPDRNFSRDELFEEFITHSAATVPLTNIRLPSVRLDTVRIPKIYNKRISRKKTELLNRPFHISCNLGCAYPAQQALATCLSCDINTVKG